MKVRGSIHAGMFYAATHQTLKSQIEECFTHKLGPGKLPKVADKDLQSVVGLVCPHAGYMYSGPVAAHAYYHLAMDGKPDVVVIFGPNHYGLGSALAIIKEGVWRTPLGEVKIADSIVNKILHESRIIDVDDLAHAREHSIEVQLPFFQYLYGSDFRFVPICFMIQDLKSSREVGLAVAKALAGKNALIVASTDMTHYEPQEMAERKDKKAINSILNLDEEQFHSTIESQYISVCGYGPVIAAITAAKALDAERAQLLCYKTSGDLTGNFSSVVGYASISFMKS